MLECMLVRPRADACSRGGARGLGDQGFPSPGLLLHGFPSRSGSTGFLLHGFPSRVNNSYWFLTMRGFPSSRNKNYLVGWVIRVFLPRVFCFMVFLPEGPRMGHNNLYIYIFQSRFQTDYIILYYSTGIAIVYGRQGPKPLAWLKKMWSRAG